MQKQTNKKPHKKTTRPKNKIPQKLKKQNKNQASKDLASEMSEWTD